MTTAQRWGWGLLTVLITLSILFLLMLKAEAGGYCQQGGGHCDTTTTTQPEETTTSSSTTTTTLPEEPSTTTTAPLSTTTSSQSDTTTTTPVTSSTVPTDNTTTTTTTEPLLTLWTAGAQCQTLHADFGTGITQVDVYWRDPILGDFGPADGLTPFTESGQEMETGVNAEFILIPVVESGWTAVPDQISLHTETCTPHPSTTPPTTDPTSTPPELPLTGSGTKALVAIAAAVSTLGFMAVKEAGRE